MLSFRVICFTVMGNYHEVNDMGACNPRFELIRVSLRLYFPVVNCAAHFPLVGPNLILQLLVARNATCILNKLYLDTNRHNRKYIHRYRFVFLYRMNKHHIGI